MAKFQSCPVPTPAQFLAIIRTQTDIVKLGLYLDRVMALVSERSLVITPGMGAVIELVEGEEMVYRATAGSLSPMLGFRLDRKTSLSGLCIASGKALCCEDSETDDRVDREACRRVGLRSMVVVPLLHEGEAVGVLKVCASEPFAFSQTDVYLLGLMSELTAAAMFYATKYGGDELFRQATTDYLTGLANRALFLDHLRCGLAECRREGRGLTVLMIDMDGLKFINDTYGHSAGDAAIREMAQCIALEARESDTAARLGGDEFAVILPKVQDSSSAQQVATRIIQRCQKSFWFEGKALNIGASVGAATYPADGSLPETLMETADQRMYEAKRARQNKVLLNQDMNWC
ncbi:sensor domain-containing diguanylate cyclase [Synechocystis sp. LKSZ1]|uniref:sensor domain-containing diguanylate cyclase n=1 Tax=Synechocystis sp. LKSZ1 TaxID=3144951 RepID=UPI00336BBC7D